MIEEQVMKQALEMSCRFTQRVLVVDNDQSNLQLLGKWLNRCGFTVVTAHNGYEAVRSFNREWFDLVLTDVCMPGILKSSVMMCLLLQ